MNQRKKRVFEEEGYYLSKNLFSKSKISTLEKEFDKIVSQLKQSGENINARWGGDLVKNLDTKNSKVIHTHNVQSFSSIMLNMVQSKKLLEIAKSFIGPDIILHHTKLFLKPPKFSSFLKSCILSLCVLFNLFTIFFIFLNSFKSEQSSETIISSPKLLSRNGNIQLFKYLDEL